MSKRIRPTLTQLAKTTGYSASTVSRALKGDPRVSPSTLETIQAAADAVGFTQNSLASSLRSGGTAALIGLLVPDVQDPFFAAISSAIQQAATSQGREVLLGCHLNSEADQARLISQMVSHRIQALIIAPSPGPLPQILIQEVGFGTPLVLLDRPAPNLVSDAIVTENRAGARSLTKNMLSRGHQRFLVTLLARTIWTQQERLSAIIETLSEAGLDLDPANIVSSGTDGTLNKKDIAAALTAPEPPTAMIALSIQPLLTTLRVANELGVSLEYSSFDSNHFYDLLPVPVWCVNQDPGEIGRLAVDRVLAQFEKEKPTPATISLPLSDLMRRGGGFHCERNSRWDRHRYNTR